MTVKRNEVKEIGQDVWWWTVLETGAQQKKNCASQSFFKPSASPVISSCLSIPVCYPLPPLTQQLLIVPFPSGPTPVLVPRPSSFVTPSLLFPPPLMQLLQLCHGTELLFRFFCTTQRQERRVRFFLDVPQRRRRSSTSHQHSLDASSTRALVLNNPSTIFLDTHWSPQ